MPDAHSLIDRTASTSPSKLQVVGARGPLTQRQSKDLLDRLRSQNPNSDILDRHLAIEQAVAETPLIVGNHTQLLRDGAMTFDAMFDAIRQARRHLNLEYFTFENVRSGDEALGDLLVAKRGQGVEINILYDSYGSSTTPSAFFDRLKAAGITVLSFNPVNPLDARGDYSLNDRDHRKILIADGTTAIVGGVNLSQDYESRPYGPLQPAWPRTSEYWRDTDLEISGPAVAALQALFVQHWDAQKGPALDETSFFPKPVSAGDEVIRVIGSTSQNGIPRFYVTLLSAIRTAEQRIWIATAYFVPTHDEIEDLADAARRGVDVRLLVPGESDSDLALNVGRSHYDELLEAGVKIFETRNEILHSKTAVIDGVWSVVGSSNFDHRSVLFNDEVDAVVLGRATARELESMFEEDSRAATSIGLEEWERRPIHERAKEFLSRLVTDLL